ncbi:MAG: Flp pilus assembly protein CpaB [Acidobacteria bacterium]|nr:Flp pilus assembly protein CpaB [Acidobacteriota bacterium]
MARIRVFIVLVLAIAAGGTFALATYRYIQNLPAQSSSIPTRPVVVAAADLDVGAELRPEDVRLVEWPAGAVPQNAFDAAQEVIGRGVIFPLVRDEPILASKLAAKEAGAGLPPIIPPGLRALSVRVNDVIGVAGYVLPGTRVDVVATVNPTQNQTDVTSKVVLTNVQVLAAGTRIERDGDQGRPVSVSVVTLLVDPTEAERLTLASTEGKIQLALRNPLDKEAPATPGIRPAALLGAAPAARRPAQVGARPTAASAAAAPPPPPTIEIIRGDKRVQEPLRQE